MRLDVVVRCAPSPRVSETNDPQSKQRTSSRKLTPRLPASQSTGLATYFAKAHLQLAQPGDIVE
jgi:hypothetical protein